MKKVLIYLLFVFINSGLLSAQTGGQILFQSPGKDGHPYRIPALTTLHNGRITPPGVSTLPQRARK